MPPRLRSLLGTRIDQIGIEQLQRLIGLVEDSDLEFKSRPYERTDGERKEAALDLATLANGNGGLLLFGVDEDGVGAAVSFRPSRQDDDFPLWIDQVSASRIFPYLPIGVHTVEVEGGVVYVVSIPPSLRTPHAVASGDSLRYPIRAGRHRRYLSESEIADHYQRRFVSVADRAKELDRLLTIGNNIALGSEHPDWVWMVIGLVPDGPGDLQLRRNLGTEWASWVPDGLKDFPCYDDRGVRCRIALGFRSLVIHDSMVNTASTYRVGGQLMLDGSGVLVFAYDGGEGNPGSLKDSQTLYDEFVVGDLINGLGVLAQHSLRAGAVGDIQVAAEVLGGTKTLVLGECRSPLQGVLPGTRPIGGGTGVSRHTLSLEGSAGLGSDRLSSVRAIVADLFSAFGVAEPLQITSDNKIVRGAFHRDFQPRIGAWLEKADVEVSDTV